MSNVEVTASRSWKDMDAENRRMLMSVQKFMSSRKSNEAGDVSDESEERDEGDDADDDDDDEEDKTNNIYYDDFFGKKAPKRSYLDENSDEEGGEGVIEDEEDEENDFEEDKDEEYDEVDDNDYTEENLELQKSVNSLFEERQRRLRNKISNIEKRALAPKQWHMMGEVTAKDRPVDSLLEMDVDFTKAVREAPMKSEKTSRTLQSIIDQRARDQSWDDVVRKEKPKSAVIKYERKRPIRQEKSDLSLAAVYEKEFTDKLQDLQTTDSDRKLLAEQPFYETEDELRIERKWKQVSEFLDTLTNFQFIPRAIVGRQTVQVASVPAFTREDVVPITTQTTSQLAPEEVFRKPKTGVLVAKEELTRTDKKRQNRKRKKKQSAIAAATAAKKQRLEAKAAKAAKSEEKTAAKLKHKSSKK